MCQRLKPVGSAKGFLFAEKSRLTDNNKQARKQGYYITMYYVGLSSMEESIDRITNRARKGGRNIPVDDVKRRYEKRISSLSRVIPLCDEVIFYDNEN